MAETLFEESRRYILGKMRGILREGGRKLPTDRELAGEMFASGRDSSAASAVPAPISNRERRSFSNALSCPWYGFSPLR